MRLKRARGVLQKLLFQNMLSSQKLSNYSRAALALVCVALLASCSANEEAGRDAARTNAGRTIESAKQATSASGENAVRASASEAKVSAGGAGEATVTLNIEEGFHINSNEPGDKYLIATKLTASSEEGVNAGAPVYPSGLRKKYPYSEQELSVYEGDVTIKLPVKASAEASKGSRSLRAQVIVQPCSDTECFQPRTLSLTIPVTIE